MLDLNTRVSSMIRTLGCSRTASCLPPSLEAER
jgi:hypothetical protein